MHRDLKPQNLVMDDGGNVALVDFGGVQETYYNTFMRGSTMVGTFGYMAPEQFRGQAVPQTDLYALAATGLFLLTHRSPAELPQERLRVSFRDQVQISDGLADWLERCLEPDLSDRTPSAKAAAAQLRGRLVLPNWQRVVPWKMVAGVGAATVAIGVGLNTVKYDLLELISWGESATAARLICREINANNLGEVQSFLRFGDTRKKIQKITSCNHFSSKLLQEILAQRTDSKDKLASSYPYLLNWTIYNGSLQDVQALLDAGANLNSEDFQLVNTLELAMKRDSWKLTRDEVSLSMLKLLLEKGANPNPPNYSPLRVAIEKNSLKMVELLLTHGADPNSKIDTYSSSPLSIAIQTSSPEIVRLLIEKGANVNARDDGQISTEPGTLPIEYASTRSSPEIINLLIQQGAEIRLAPSYGHPIWRQAAAKGSRETLKLLLAKGIDINETDQDGNSLLHVVARTGSLENIQFLLAKGANIHAKNKEGKTVLHWSATSNSLEAMKLLIAKGAELDVSDNSLLLAAVSSGSEQIVQFLLEKGANVNGVSRSGETALHAAIGSSNSPKLIALLLDKGANINAKNSEGITALHVAVQHGSSIETIKLLLTRKLLIAKGAQLDVSDDSLLLAAVSSGSEQIVQFLLEKGANVNGVSRSGETALHTAVRRNKSSKLTALLLDKGANINAKNSEGTTALHVAAQYGSIETIKLLLAKGADVNVTTMMFPHTALEAAVHRTEGDQLKVLEMMLARGANLELAETKTSYPGGIKAHIQLLRNAARSPSQK
ncbi:MAG: ankyrin repeat domain-containing protein [Synechococcales bacterium]|nr:ankyrin repeat domain-containing protein [Synechococcales bacterium]